MLFKKSFEDFELAKSRQRILHICRQDKFTRPFIDIIEESFDPKDHMFWIKGDEAYTIPNKANYIFYMKKSVIGQLTGYLLLIFLMAKAEKIILHSLLSGKVTFLLFTMPWVLKKSYWVIWGSDLYAYNAARKSFSSKIWERIRHSVIRNIGHLVTYIPGDVKAAKKWYHARGEHHECFMYTNNTINRYVKNLAHIKQENSSQPSILLGNSGDPSNEHLEMFKIIHQNSDKLSKIILPLSYGKASYIMNIRKKGFEYFREKFHPLDKFMDYQNYISLLSEVDIALFNHKRQQAMGTTITLLALGKTLYLRPDTNQWNFLADLGVTVKNINDAGKLTPLDEATRRKNMMLVHTHFSISRLIAQLDNLFS